VNTIVPDIAELKSLLSYQKRLAIWSVKAFQSIHKDLKSALGDLAPELSAKMTPLADISLGPASISEDFFTEYPVGLETIPVHDPEALIRFENGLRPSDATSAVSLSAALRVNKAVMNYIVYRCPLGDPENVGPTTAEVMKRVFGCEIGKDINTKGVNGKQKLSKYDPGGRIDLLLRGECARRLFNCVACTRNFLQSSCFAFCRCIYFLLWFFC
jgi:hypothetical protein